MGLRTRILVLIEATVFREGEGKEISPIHQVGRVVFFVCFFLFAQEKNYYELFRGFSHLLFLSLSFSGLFVCIFRFRAKKVEDDVLCGDCIYYYDYYIL